MKPLQKGPVFLRIQWNIVPEGDGEAVTVEAALCRDHREEISLQFPTARGLGRLDESCDLCEGRIPGRSADRDAPILKGFP